MVHFLVSVTADRDVVRKRRSFKMTQNTFDKIWRRLPVALEY